MSDAAARLYLDLLKRSLTRTLHPEFEPAQLPGRNRLRREAARRLAGAFTKRGLALVREIDVETRRIGGDWPFAAETMIGMARLDSLEECIVRVLKDGISGDLIETGVWRGGSVIFMRAVLAAYEDDERSVWVADSFEGVPSPNETEYPADAGDELHARTELAVSQQIVAENFRRYGLLDDRVRFLPGWFRDTLPTAPIERLAVLRLDGDLYESTRVALDALYPKLSSGGFCIVDDYGAMESCRAAVRDFRAAHAITDPLETIDWTGVFWRRS